MTFGPIEFSLIGFIALYVGCRVGQALKEAEAQAARKLLTSVRRQNDTLIALLERERTEREISEVRRVS
jgi:hypothetical protein